MSLCASETERSSERAIERERKRERERERERSGTSDDMLACAECRVSKCSRE